MEKNNNSKFSLKSQPSEKKVGFAEQEEINFINIHNIPEVQEDSTSDVLDIQVGFPDESQPKSNSNNEKNNEDNVEEEDDDEGEESDEENPLEDNQDIDQSTSEIDIRVMSHELIKKSKELINKEEASETSSLVGNAFQKMKSSLSHLVNAISVASIPMEDIGMTKNSDIEKPSDVKKSEGSVSKASSDMNRINQRFVFEISETLVSKLYFIKWVFLSLLVNSMMYLWMVSIVDGISVSVNLELLETLGTAIFEIIMLLSNIITLKAMDDAFAFICANIICNHHLSLAVFGFWKTSAIWKYNFAAELSLNSTVRKPLSRVSLLWIILEVLKIITPLPATSLLYESVHEISSPTPCIVFATEGNFIDRKWPNWQSKAGYAELIFGNGIGVLRSQVPTKLDNTTAIIFPQIVGAVQDGDSLIGDGFTVDIQAECLCTSISTEALTQVGIPTHLISSFQQGSYNVSGGMALVSVIDSNSTTIKVFSNFIGTNQCGGILNRDRHSICITKFQNFQKATIHSTFMTDGTPASIAIYGSKILEQKGLEDIKWVDFALRSFLELAPSNMHFNPTVPGMLSPLLWWTSSDLLAVNPSLYEVGVETMFDIFLQGAVQRTFKTKGTFCPTIVKNHYLSMMKMNVKGNELARIMILIQLIFTILALLCCSIFMTGLNPVGPAVRAFKENAYFTTLLNESNLIEHVCGLANAPAYAFWQNLDSEMRIGETFDTVELDVGKISVNRSKLIRKLTNGKKYC